MSERKGFWIVALCRNCADGAWKLTEAVQVNTAMQELNYLTMVSEAYTSLAGALRLNATLQATSVQKNGAAESEVITQVLQVNSTLQILELSYGKVIVILKGADSFETLRVNSIFRRLTLSD